MRNNITAANSVIVLSCEELYPAGIQLQNYSADQSITQADEEFAVTRMGVDGSMAAGYVPAIKSVTIAIEPFSPSCEALDTIYRASQSNRRPYKCTLSVTIPGLGKSLTYNNGVLKSWKLSPDNRQTLDPINAVFDFESVE